METIEPRERVKVSPIFQATMIFLSASIIALGFSIRTAYFRSLDEPMIFKTISPQKLREFGGFPESINVGLQIDHFHEFDVIKNQFTFSGNVWFEFEGDAVAIEPLSDFEFDRATILYRSEPDTKVIGSKLVVRYVIKVAFNTGLVYADFPADSHRVNLVLTHPFISPEEIVFENKADDFIFEDELWQFGWRKAGLVVKQGYGESKLSEQGNEKTVLRPLVGFSIDVQRYGARSLLAILLPIWLIYYLMFFALSVDAGPSITVALGGITGILAYRYVIEQLSPKTGDLMISDYIFFLILASAMLIFLFTQFDLYVIKLSLAAKKIGIALIHLFTVLVSIYLLIP